MKIRLPKNEKGFPSQFPTEEEIRKCKNNDSILRGIRGNVIAYTIEMEHWIDIIIEAFLFGKRANEKSQLFEELLLQKEWFNLMNKWKLLRDLLKAHKKENSELVRNIKTIIDTRNSFSHGEIEFELDGRALLVYHQEGRKEIELNNEYFDGLNKLFKETLNSLEELNAEIRS